MPSKRIACVHIVHLPVQVERTLDGRLAGAPFIVSGLALKPESMLDVSPEAVGVHVAMNVRQAKQACPHAQVVAPREELYYSIHGTIVQICGQFSPQVETAGLGLFFIDVSDMERLCGDEHQLSLALLQSIRYSTNLAEQIGIAGNKFTAEQCAVLKLTPSRMLAQLNDEAKVRVGGVNAVRQVRRRLAESRLSPSMTRLE